MKLKGKFKQSSVITQFLILFFIVIIGSSLVFTIAKIILIVKFEIKSPIVIQEIVQYIKKDPEWIKSTQFFQSICMFIIPAIICAWLFSDNYKSYLRIDTPFQLSIIGLVFLSMLIIIPFLNSIYKLNQQIIFPKCLKELEEWMKNQEQLTKNIIKQMLYTHCWQDLVYTIMIVCVFTSIGEEFIFRGVLQNILGKFIKNTHVIIWISAIFFSTIHLQFYGFLPRMLLGAYLGYLLYYSNNIWIPVLAHFTNNFLGVIAFYFFQKKIELAEQINKIGNGVTWLVSIVSLVLFFVLFYKIKNHTSSNFIK